MRSRVFIIVFVLLSVLANAAKVAVAQTPAQALEPYLTEDVVAVAYVDLTKIDLPGLLEWGRKLGIDPGEEDREQAVKMVLQMQERLDKFTGLGARHVYVLFRASDLVHQGPTFVVPVAKAGNSQAVLEMILSGKQLNQVIRPRFLAEHWTVVDGAVLGAHSAAQLELLKTKRPPLQADLSAAWKSLGTGHCGLLVFGNKDSRRVAREMFPKLPAPFAAIEGRLLADHVEWAGVVVDFPPQPRLQVLVQTNNSDATESLQQAAVTGLEMLEQFPPFQEILEKHDRKALIATLTPSISDNRLTISFNDVLNDIDRLTRQLSPHIQAARQAAQRTTRINKFKQLGLAMLNYESANRAYPPQASYSETGQPLLSWRVHILPYMEDGKLYEKFHLDEPWDSEHNFQLISQMPAAYADPDPKLKKLNAQGRTTYVVPMGEGTVFAGPEGTLIRDIKDGTAYTILTVEVSPENAVIWTKPADWQVNLEKPHEGMSKSRGLFTAGFCDGHVMSISSDIAAEALRAYLTKDGGEDLP